MSDREWYYRYSDGWQGIDNKPYICIEKHPVYRKTPMGVQLGWSKDALTFVNNSHAKRFAYPTKAEALDSYRRRKAKHVQILKAQLMRAESNKHLADEITAEDDQVDIAKKAKAPPWLAFEATEDDFNIDYGK